MTQLASGAWKGIGCVVAAGLCFAVLDSTAKVVVASVPVLMVLWVRYMMQAVFSTVLLLPRHGASLFRTRHPWLQLLRGALLSLTTMLALWALRFLPVGEFTAIVMVTPLTVTVLAVVLWREHVLRLQWVFVVGGFLGTVCIVRPGGEIFGWAAALPLACMACNSAFQLLTSHLTRTESAATTHFLSGWVGAIVMTLALPFMWSSVDSSVLWLMMVSMGVLASIGHFLLTLAYRYAPASTLMPYLYCHVGFAVMAGWIVFAHVPDGWSQVGIGLIAVCGACSAWLTARSRRLPAVVSDT
jgi:drug/metabolite transporter (DMT)-like permease